ncbi:MAG: nucleotidyltransferase substrate binding protein [Alphaproteobacteria bacterium]
MSSISTEFLNRCIETLEKSYSLLLNAPKDSIDYEMYRNSLVKGFEMTLEQGGKLLRKKLKPYFASSKEVDKLAYKELFRHALKHGLLEEALVERWFKYRDNRNSTTHDYGEKFASETISLIEDFIKDAKKLEGVIAND